MCVCVRDVVIVMLIANDYLFSVMIMVIVMLRLERNGNGKIGTENMVMANIVQTLNFLGSEFVLYNNQLLMLCNALPSYFIVHVHEVNNLITMQLGRMSTLLPDLGQIQIVFVISRI